MLKNRDILLVADVLLKVNAAMLKKATDLNLQLDDSRLRAPDCLRWG